MSERKKLELQLNLPANLELLYDDPVIGQSQYGDYYLYAVRNGNGAEYSFFAPSEVHDQIKSLRKGSKVTITKLAEQKGSKIITKYDIKIKEDEVPAEKPVTANNGNDNYYELMLQSCKDAVRIQNELGGLMDAKSLAVTLFIARSKVNGNGIGG
jgi:hypothetical protein